jgi:hypothetical protein
VRYPNGPHGAEREYQPPSNTDTGTKIWRNRKVLIVAALVLAAVIAGCTTWIVTSGGSSGYKEETISSIFGQQTIRTKGSSAQLCSNGKWVPIKKNGSQITFPGGTRISIGGASCSNAGPGTSRVAVLSLIAAAVLEAVTLGLLALTSIKGRIRPLRQAPHPAQ